MDYNGLKGSVLILGLIMALLITTTHTADLTGPTEANRIIIIIKKRDKESDLLSWEMFREELLQIHYESMRQYFQYATNCCIDEC